MSVRLLELLGDPRLRAVLIFAALVRLVIGLDLWFSDPLARVPLSDPAYYHAWASALASGEGFRASAPYWLPPLYPWVLSLVFEAVGPAIGVVLVLQHLVGLFGTALLMLLSYRVAGRRAAIAAGLLWSLYAPVVFFESRLLPVNLALPLCLFALNLLVRYEHRLSRASEAARESGGLALPGLSGLLLGLASMARPNLLLVGPVIAAAWIAFRKSVRPSSLGLAALMLGMVIGISPSMAINYLRGGELIPVTANGGVNFWFGNNEQAHGTFHAPSAEWGSIGTQRDVSIALATEGLGRGAPVSEAEASDWWFARGRRFLLDSPGAALRLWGLKLADTLSSTEFGIQYYPAAIRRLAPSLWLAALPFGLLLALGVLGLADPKREARVPAVLVAWLGAGLLGSLLYFTYSRFRLPTLIAWMPFAGRGACVLLDALRQRVAPPARGVVLALALLAFSFVPFEGEYPRQLEANTLLDAGLAAQQLGDVERAYELVELSLERVPLNPRALVVRGKLFALRGDESAALLDYRTARDLPGRYPSAVLNYCRMLLAADSPALRDPEAAVRELRESIEGEHSPDSNLMLLLATALIDYPALARSPGEARALVREVLRRSPGHPGALQLLRLLDEDR